MSVRIFWSLSIGFLAGVFFRSLYALSWPVAAFCIFIALIVLAASHFDSARWRAHLLIAVTLVAIAAGIVRMDAARLVGDVVLNDHLGAEVEIEGVVVREPDVRESSARVTVDADALVLGSSTIAVDTRILVIAPAHTTLKYGDHVRARGELRLPETFASDGGRVFNYPMFLAKDGVLYTLVFAETDATGESVAHHPANAAQSVAISIKQLFLRGVRAAIPEPEAGLASGITVGEKRSMGEDLSDAFTRSSLVHVVVLSGYNITIVINGASRLLAHAPRALQFGSSGFVVLLFILMTGGAATAVRAGLMALIAAYARTSGRVFIALRALAVASVLMVVWNPYTLLFDPSFQLSVCATLGLVLFTPIFSRWLPRIPERFALREIVASTLATQLTVLPLLLYQSGSLSLVAIPANLLVLAAIPPAMALSGIAAIGGLFAGPLAPLFGLPAYAMLAYIINVAEICASLPFAAITVPAFHPLLLVPMYACIFGTYGYMQKKMAGQRARPFGR